MATKKTIISKNKEVEKKPLLAALELEQLRNMNLWLALIFGVQAVAAVLFGGSKVAPVTTSYLATDQLSTQAAGHQVVAAAVRHLFDIRFTVVIAIFLTVFALTSLALATVGRARYELRLQQGMHVGRWLSFALGGGLMVAAIGLESGVYQVAGLLALFGFTLIGIGLEPLTERLHREAKGTMLAKAVCIVGLASAILPWIILGIGILGALLWNGHVSGSVYMMYGATLVLFGCWGLAAYFRMTSRGRWSDVLYTEKMYMFLNLVAATILAWQIFAGAL